MKYFKQSLLTITSSLIVMALFYLFSFIINFAKITQPVNFAIAEDIIIIALALIVNFIFGRLLGNKSEKKGYIIQFAVLLIIAVLNILFENTYIFNISTVLNPVYSYAKDLIWQFDPLLSDNIILKCVMAFLFALFPALLMLSGSRKHELKGKKS